MLIKITSKNTGSKDAYQTSYKFVFSKYAELIENKGDLLNKKDLITLTTDESNGDTIISFNSKNQIPPNTKDAYNIYLKFDFGEEPTDTDLIERRNLEEDDNERVILKSANVNLCQNVECNDEESFVNQNVNINFKITRNVFPNSAEEQNVDNSSNKEEKGSNAWIAAVIVVVVVIIGAAIFIIFDYKKKILFFKKKHNSIPSSELKEKNEDVNIYNTKSQSNDLV